MRPLHKSGIPLKVNRCLGFGEANGGGPKVPQLFIGLTLYQRASHKTTSHSLRLLSLGKPSHNHHQIACVDLWRLANQHYPSTTHRNT